MSSSTVSIQEGKFTRLIATLVFSLISFVFFAPGQAEATPAAQKETGETSAKVEPVESNKVCMVNNTLFRNEQIPVEVDGRTYYGCCDMCKGRLANDETVRYAVDPVSKKKVDKAKAVIGAKPDKSVLYFESKKTLEQYNASVDR